MNDEKKVEQLSGLACSLSFIALSVILFFLPDYFSNVIITRIVCIILALFGIAGLSSELTKFHIDFSNFGYGFLFLIIWVILYVYLGKFWYINIIGLLILFIGLYGITLGFSNALKLIFTEKSSQKGFWKSVFIFATKLLTFLFTVLQIFKLIGILKP